MAAATPVPLNEDSHGSSSKNSAGLKLIPSVDSSRKNSAEDCRNKFLEGNIASWKLIPSEDSRIEKSSLLIT
jgi:predicted transposase YbfD/YdcC